VFYRIEGGGHTWPGRTGLLQESIYGRTTANVDANTLMWDFFKKHPRS
jgi:polyhydroxybutyrate depolymerase